MKGGIYSKEKCHCGAGLVDNGRNAVACPVHKKHHARRIHVVFQHAGTRTEKKFTDYTKASRFLTGLRFKVDEGTYDARDYKASNPLGFENLANEWLAVKKVQIKAHSWDNLNNTMRRAAAAWGTRNIKEIGFAEIEDFLFKTLSGSSSKSRANARSAINSFFSWLVRRRVIHLSQRPEMPEVSFELAFRKTVDKPTQEAILSELCVISRDVNPRIWLAARWLATYFSIRPAELIALKEGDIDRENGFLIIPHPKEKKPKVIPLTDDDLALVRTLPVSFPELYFFRHVRGIGGSKAGERFGPRYLWKWWKKACDNLGIKGVDLYGGTRHSTVIALGEQFTPEQLKAASFHATNKAFERYYRVKPDQVRAVYTAAAGGQRKANEISGPKSRKVIGITGKIGGGGGS